MPRARKTMSGDRAQSIKSVPGQRYGEGVEQQALQRNLPAPARNDVPSPSTGASALPPSAGAPVTPPPPAADPAMIQQYLAQHRPNLLGGTQMPDTPVTDGLSSGPGRGPNALMENARTPISRMLRQLAADTGNPKWQRMAERAGM